MHHCLAFHFHKYEGCSKTSFITAWLYYPFCGYYRTPEFRHWSPRSPANDHTQLRFCVSKLKLHLASIWSKCTQTKTPPGQNGSGTKRPLTTIFWVSARTAWQFASVTFEHGDFFIFELFTHPFNGLLSRTTWVSQYQKVKTNLDFTEARDSEWQWHQLGYMQVCTSIQTDNHTSTQAGCPSCRPARGVKALRAHFWQVIQKIKIAITFWNTVYVQKNKYICANKNRKCLKITFCLIVQLSTLPFRRLLLWSVWFLDDLLLSVERKALLDELSSMPVRNDTLRIRTKREELEQKLNKVEEAIKIFSRKKVFVKMDA